MPQDDVAPSAHGQAPSGPAARSAPEQAGQAQVSIPASDSTQSDPTRNAGQPQHLTGIAARSGTGRQPCWSPRTLVVRTAAVAEPGRPARPDGASEFGTGTCRYRPSRSLHTRLSRKDVGHPLRRVGPGRSPSFSGSSYLTCPPVGDIRHEAENGPSAVAQVRDETASPLPRPSPSGVVPSLPRPDGSQHDRGSSQPLCVCASVASAIRRPADGGAHSPFAAVRRKERSVGEDACRTAPPSFLRRAAAAPFFTSPAPLLPPLTECRSSLIGLGCLVRRRTLALGPPMVPLSVPERGGEFGPWLQHPR
ncbi:hypothetical protein CDD83_5388 [Cordyceps sp. RAO-2017]|nr:hypothetical protein CDD83_5388 [Cordyceps sp. RAO-2017]